MTGTEAGRGHSAVMFALGLSNILLGFIGAFLRAGAFRERVIYFGYYEHPITDVFGNYYVFANLSDGVAIVLWLLLIAGGFGLLLSRRWAKVLSISVAAMYITWTAVLVIVGSALEGHSHSWAAWSARWLAEEFILAETSHSVPTALTDAAMPLRFAYFGLLTILLNKDALKARLGRGRSAEIKS